MVVGVVDPVRQEEEEVQARPVPATETAMTNRLWFKKFREQTQMRNANLENKIEAVADRWGVSATLRLVQLFMGFRESGKQRGEDVSSRFVEKKACRARFMYRE